MSWLHNMSVPSRTTVTLHEALRPKQTTVRVCYNLRHAIQHGLPWAEGARLPRPVAQFCKGAAPLAPWLLLALLALAEPSETLDPGSLAKRILQSPREVAPEAAIAALESARRRRNLHGALLVRLVGSPAETVLQNDLVLTLLLLAQSTDRVFVAGKQPLLDHLHPGLTLELITLPGVLRRKGRR